MVPIYLFGSCAHKGRLWLRECTQSHHNHALSHPMVRNYPPSDPISLPVPEFPQRTFFDHYHTLLSLVETTLNPFKFTPLSLWPPGVCLQRPRRHAGNRWFLTLHRLYQMWPATLPLTSQSLRFHSHHGTHRRRLVAPLLLDRKTHFGFANQDELLGNRSQFLLV